MMVRDEMYIYWLINCFDLYLFRFALSSMDMGLKDYDSRTALHIAAAEGERHTIVLLVFRWEKEEPLLPPAFDQ